ncbi:MAG: NUDIX domain-containing protein [Arthrobacter sp.]|uniref:NUDIX domain-containing protein n=1 Tax=unclassified Arthrobacter TaxID=235627 RepID=UPI00264A89C1|nr:NUDIX domain-containing protein [Micrococcaceae bacterium]MDN5811559.1 NUDIX domain-containing protein [Micrococcaceae bacterium]MDN5823582.1 NUDIX domain-containing protein [Micrococcaceae bacterium]MDN5878326.1 NUDIX domain-containing protein [Micrococcaceae bacterium]MDN5887125.1 NUDIX domain-containing protein [Micrococcaceae bacterium]
MAPTPATPPVQVVLCLPILNGLTGRQVLLGLKQRGFGAGHVVAPGGKIEPGESPAQAAARELHEETSVLTDPATLEPAARVYFRFPANPAADMDCQVFLTTEFSGMAAASDELLPGWYPVGHLPLDRMWEDSPLWLDRLFRGERFDALVRLGDDNESVAHFATIAWPEGTMPDAPATESDFPTPA